MWLHVERSYIYLAELLIHEVIAQHKLLGGEMVKQLFQVFVVFGVIFPFLQVAA